MYFHLLTIIPICCLNISVVSKAKAYFQLGTMWTWLIFLTCQKMKRKQQNVKKASRVETVEVNRYVMKQSKFIKWNTESKPKTLHK